MTALGQKEELPGLPESHPGRMGGVLSVCDHKQAVKNDKKLTSHGQNLKNKNVLPQQHYVTNTGRVDTRTFSHKLYKSQNTVFSIRIVIRGVTVDATSNLTS